MATSETLTFQIVGENGFTVRFKMFFTDPVLKAIKAYVQCRDKDIRFFAFLLNGDYISPYHSQTPKSLGMEDGDVINAFIRPTYYWPNMTFLIKDGGGFEMKCSENLTVPLMKAIVDSVNREKKCFHNGYPPYY